MNYDATNTNRRSNRTSNPMPYSWYGVFAKSDVRMESPLYFFVLLGRNMSHGSIIGSAAIAEIAKETKTKKDDYRLVRHNVDWQWVRGLNKFSTDEPTTDYTPVPPQVRQEAAPAQPTATDVPF